MLIVPTFIKSLAGRSESNPVHTAKLDSLVKLLGTVKKIEKPSIKYFKFDPNTITLEELKSLGLSSEVAGRVINFRSKGKGFQVKSDFKKIYGLSMETYHTLEPYLTLPEYLKPRQKIQSQKSKKRIQTFKIDANKADTTEFKRIRGIGKVLSARIIKYRNKLGGFYSVIQIKEVYGISEFALENALQVLYVSEKFSPKQIPINTSSYEVLGAHPYIGYKTAKKITAYRYQHGKYTSLSQLVEFGLVDQEQFQKMSQYLSL